MGAMAWVIDLDGVVWLDGQAIAGSAEAIEELRARDEDVVFVTNNSSERLATYEDRLAAIGIPASGCVISSAMIAASLVAPDERALVCTGEGVVEALRARGAEVVRDGDADVVVVGFHRDFDYQRMTTASVAVRHGARLLATNDDPTYPGPDGPIPGGGAILASIVTATGATPVIAGKPYPPSAAYVRERLGASGVVVGDRPSTDGGFATALGYPFVLVLSGVTHRADLPVVPEPALVADDLLMAVRAGVV
jgi:HAD superfamily hydrolase (TIGR01450 family)